ncbi:MAG: retroviral-like aspartic protease family protein [Gemmataceae bacterium]|nr:retroviral-like aspartic protease family protein [Gemmataceae bacterium]
MTAVEHFPPEATRLVLPVTITGPRVSHEFRLRLDTGSDITVVPTLFLRRLGCDLSRPAGRTRLRSLTGVAWVPLIRVPAASALGRVRTDFLVAAHDFPIGVEADGLLGLDFARGRIALRRPRPWWQFW